MKRQPAFALSAFAISAVIICGCGFAARHTAITPAERDNYVNAIHVEKSGGSSVRSKKDSGSDTVIRPVSYEYSGESEFDSEIRASSAILVNTDTESVLYGKNTDEKVAPASTAKLATALTAVTVLPADAVITAGTELDMVAFDSSRAGIIRWETYTFEELLEGMLIASGNDAAYVIAKAAGQKLIEDDISYRGEVLTDERCVLRFLREMNRIIHALGLTHTRFLSPDGYDCEGQYTTAEDLSKIALAAGRVEMIRTICGMESASATDGKYDLVTTNELLHADSKYYYSYATGMKTGSTDLAGNCLVATATKDGKSCISVVMNSTVKGRYKDTLKLLRFFDSTAE